VFSCCCCCFIVVLLHSLSENIYCFCFWCNFFFLIVFIIPLSPVARCTFAGIARMHTIFLEFWSGLVVKDEVGRRGNKHDLFFFSRPLPRARNATVGGFKKPIPSI